MNKRLVYIPINYSSWLTSQTSPVFSQNLFYTEPVDSMPEASLSAPRYYNGNIAGINESRWTPQGIITGYKAIMYDNLNRISRVFDTEPDRYNEWYSYDLNGNITSIRRGEFLNTLYDDISISYVGNRMDRVVDNSETDEFLGEIPQLGATGHLLLTDTIGYDASGRLTSDYSRGITSVTYNPLDLPQMIKMGAKDRISYTYRSDGVKMREQSVHQYTKLVMKVSASGDTTYVQRNASDTHYRAHYGSYVKETCQPDKIYNEEGYIALHGDSVSYHFFERDYLGSVRAVFDLYGNLEQTNDYNATGVPSSRHLGNADVHKHTGKEFQGFNGLAWYDNQARYYDPILARFSTHDPLAETTPWNSPYAHCSNNPLNRIDPLGLVDYFLLNGKHYKTIDDGNNTKQLILTRSKDNADEYIENNLYITVPTDKIVQQMKNVYNLTEKTGHEYGFVVGENGMYSTVIAGSTTEIGSGWSDAKSEIASKGDIVAYDVHSHPNLRSSTEAYNSALSSIEDRESISGNQPCIILGYNYKLYIPINQIAGSPQISYHQSIGFYNKETDILSLDFSDFCRIVKKINRYDNKK